ncbi:dihydrolipoyllysine-residue acetyltransferase [Burkholderia sp. USMB20]|uniref:dihydrolipoyllysine-residue acetyltransferase n=1 Tax=Burkholderia sp. USMB20 TaxID=1571773 RepID=UPI000698D8D2|nr:dihydrolipoyllysine-residue acetyltransferase [Burkholderia sp. USMB20]
MAMKEVFAPDIGDFKDVEIIDLLIKAGDVIEEGQSLVTVESDKASIEIPSSHAGVVQELFIQLGDKISQGSLLLSLREAGAHEVVNGTASTTILPTAPAPVAISSETIESLAPSAEPNATPATHARMVVPGVVTLASPSIRKLARELGVQLESVTGSGPKGRILRDDVHHYVKGAMVNQPNVPTLPHAEPAGRGLTGLLPWPEVDFSKFGPIDRRDLSRIKKISGANLHRNWVMIPHVTNHEEADITDLEAFRTQINKENATSGIKVTMLAFLVKACVAALRKFPEFNASLDGEQIVLKQYYHVGFAADTPNGLVVPVIKDADKKGVLAIAKEMGELAVKAREGKLTPHDMTGGSFSISSLGGIGGTNFTPIINAPEVAILGLCRSSTKPVWDGTTFVPRLILPLSLSWDHRVIDGAAAARFNAYLAQTLTDIRRTIL